MKKKYITTIITLFVLLTVVFYALCKSLPDYKMPVLMGGNIVMAILSLLSFFLVSKQLHERPQAFIRGVYAGTFLKLFVCMIAIFVYVIANRPNIHKPSIFVLFGIYAIYTVAETSVLQKMAKGNN